MDEYAVEKCSHCGRLIKAPETQQVKAMRPEQSGSPATFKALGLTTRVQATTIVIVGLFLAPLVVGIPLIIWGAVAAAQFKTEMKRTGQWTQDMEMDLWGVVVLIIVLTGIVIVVMAEVFGGAGM